MYPVVAGYTTIDDTTIDEKTIDDVSNNFVVSNDNSQKTTL